MPAYHADITLQLHLLVDSTDLDAAHHAAKTAACLRPGIRAEQISGIYCEPLSPQEERDLANLCAWQESEALRTHGDASQRQRWLAGVLPESELLEVARRELFRSFVLLAKRRRMTFADIPHPKEAGIWTCLKMPRDVRFIVRDSNDLVDWSTEPNPALTATEHRTLLAIQEASQEAQRHPWLRKAREAAEVQIRGHRGVCKVCRREARDKSALVTVRWAGRTLSREYAL